MSSFLSDPNYPIHADQKAREVVERVRALRAQAASTGVRTELLDTIEDLAQLVQGLIMGRW